MDWIAILVGAVIGVWLLSRLLMVTALRWMSEGTRLAWAYPLTLALATILYGFGSADGGEPAFAAGFFLYLPGVVLWAAVDAVRFSRRERAATAL